MPLYEDATDRALYPLSLMPGAAERLGEDIVTHGYGTLVFSTAKREAFIDSATELNILGLITLPVSLDDIITFSGNSNLIKDHPEAFKELDKYLMTKEHGRMVSYCDDTETVVKAAQEAQIGIEKFYLFGKNLKPESKGRIIVVNSLMDVN
jgi:hypothetical protein